MQSCPMWEVLAHLSANYSQLYSKFISQHTLQWVPCGISPSTVQ